MQKLLIVIEHNPRKLEVYKDLWVRLQLDSSKKEENRGDRNYSYRDVQPY